VTRIVSGFIYYIIYSFLYLFPFIVLMLIDEALNLNLLKYLERLGSFKQLIGLLFLAYAMALPGYRAKLASDAYGNRDMKFWEAHSVSGVILKTHLSFLPIIGKIFEEKK